MNFKLKDIGPQLMTVIAVVLVFGFFTYNAQVNMENRGIDFGYGFLSQESSFDVQFSLIEYDGHRTLLKKIEHQMKILEIKIHNQNQYPYSPC